MEQGNSKRLGTGKFRRATSMRWVMFDALPRELRDYINMLPFRFNVESVNEQYTALRLRGFSESKAVREVKRVLRAEAIRKRDADLGPVWNVWPQANAQDIGI